jgi:RNA ligase
MVEIKFDSENNSMSKIESLEVFRANVKHRDEIRENSIGENSTSFCYMISCDGTFDSADLRECRGIVFATAAGVVTGRPLHKFFNVNEREETRVENIDWTKVTRVMDKRDGSMIHTVRTRDGLGLKSKKSFDSDVAQSATLWLDSESNSRIKDMCEDIMMNNLTAIFEWTSPDARIVLVYPEKKLTLLHVRHNVTGAYLAYDELLKLRDYYGVEVVEQVTEFNVNGGKFNIEKMLDAVKTREGVEGWVIQFQNGNMVKVKTDWYMLRHRAMTFVRERDIVELVLAEGLDDMKAMLVGDGIDITEILAIEASVVSDLNLLSKVVIGTVEEDSHLPRKSFAIKYKEHPHFGLLMAQFIGKEPDFKAYFERNMLREKYTLRTLTMVQTSAEID